MGATYSRQSSYTDGDTITAAHTNNEFDQLLAAFAASTGHTHDGTTAEGGPITKLLGTSITVGDGTTGTDITVTFDGESNDGVFKWMEDEDYFEFSDDILIAAAEKLQFRDSAIYINSSTDGQLDLVADTEIQIAATTIDMNGNADISGNLGVGGNLTVTGTTTFNGGTITMGDAATDNVVFGADVNSSIIPNTDDTYDLGSSSQEWRDLYIDGTAYLDAVNITSIAEDTTLATDKKVQFRDTGLYINSSADGQLDIVADTEVQIAATTVDINGNVEISGDLTISGDDLTMGTNTSGHILVADGTNFNPVAVGDLSEISTVANDDVFLAVDTSGGGLKKITRSAVVSGLATSSAISNLSEDTTPQLGGNLDLNGNDIVTTSNATLDLAPNGTGTVVVRGNTNSGAVVFNCESNSHGQKVYGQPHSAGVTNTLMLPAGANSTLVSLVSTDTLTNKTLTSPKINEDVVVTSTATELNIMDGDTSAGTTAVAGGDGIVTNDNGTMRQTTVDTFDTYLSATTKTLTNKTLTTPTLTTPIANAGVQLKNGATSAGFLEFFEDSDNGTNKVTLIGPASTADITLTLPSTAGTLATTASVTTVAQDEATALAIALG